MKLQQNEKVVFDALTHSYWLGDKELSGVTSLMKEYGFSVDYEGIPTATIERAAERGTAIHELIEDYDNGKTVADTPELIAYRKLGLDVLASEYLISDNETVASSIDKVIRVDESTVDLGDIKTTSTFHKDAVSIQLGIYAYLFELQNPGIKVRNCYGIHIRNGKAKLIQVESWPKERVAELIGWKRDNVSPSSVAFGDAGQSSFPVTCVLSQEEAMSLVRAENEICRAKELIKVFEGKVAEYRDRIVCYMKDNHIVEMSAAGGVFKLKDEYTRESIDSKKLREKYPEVAAECVRTSTVKASVTFKGNDWQ